MSVSVRLTNEEMALAAIVGILRRLSGQQKSRPAAHGYNGRDPWATDIESCGAELAVAKYLNRFWSGALASGPLDQIAADVGIDIQVRSTRYSNGSLIVHKADSDEQRYWLVTTEKIPDCTLQGWLWGHEAQRDEFWTTSTGRPAYFVPQSRLHEPISDDELELILEYGAGAEELNW